MSQDIVRLYRNLYTDHYTYAVQMLQLCSGVAKAGPGWARARPKDHVRPTHVSQSCTKLIWASVKQVPGQYQ